MTDSRTITDSAGRAADLRRFAATARRVGNSDAAIMLERQADALDAR